jgi:thioredoxin 1
MIAPIIEQLLGENAATVKVVKINVDDSPNTAATHGVSAIPTVMLFKDGQVVERFVGVQPKSRLQEAINQAAG